MEPSSTWEAIEKAVRLTMERNLSLVGKWIAGEPGSWGSLAGKAVIASRQKLGRRLTDQERREVWALLWASLTGVREGPPQDS